MARTCIGTGWAYRTSAESMEGDITVVLPVDLRPGERLTLGLTAGVNEGRKGIGVELFRVEYPPGDPLHIPGLDDETDVGRKLRGG